MMPTVIFRSIILSKSLLRGVVLVMLSFRGLLVAASCFSVLGCMVESVVSPEQKVVNPSRSTVVPSVRSIGFCSPPSWDGEMEDFHGYGMSTVSQDAADRAARLEVAKQFDVQMIQEDTVREGESSGGDFWYTLRSDAVEKTNVRINGLTIRERHFNSSCGQYFAFAVLDHERSVSVLVADLQAGNQDAEFLRAQLQAQIDGGDLVGTLWALHQLLRVQEIQNAHLQRLRILDPGSCHERVVCHAYTTKILETQSRIDEVVSSIRLRRVEGNEQVVTCGGGLSGALVVKVTTMLDGHLFTPTDLPVEFAFERGSGSVSMSVPTSVHGQAEAFVTLVTPSPIAAQVKARLVLGDLPKEFPSDIKQRIEHMRSESAVYFMMYPPSDALAAGFDQLACLLVARATPAVGTVARVDVFPEKGTGLVTRLGERLREGVASALVRTRAIAVTDIAYEGGKLASVVVSGWVDHDVRGDLIVFANVKDEVTNLVQGEADVRISKGALGSLGIRGYDLAARGEITSHVQATGQQDAIVGRDGATMAFVPEGSFVMGTSSGELDEGPAHLVYLDMYYIDIHEVTTSRYAEFLLDSPKAEPHKWSTVTVETHREKPVIGVSWTDATRYCRWAGKRLPSEAEWERAARGDDERTYPWGNTSPNEQLANYNQRSSRNVYRDVLLPVHSFEAGKSPFGVLNLAGNAWEWVADWYEEDYYARSPEFNPAGPMTGEARVLRGGAWIDGPQLIRTTDRFKFAPTTETDLIGFRCAMSATMAPY